MPLSVLDDPRLERELDLRRRGYVPLSRPDALFPAFKNLVPRCRVRQELPSQYSRLLWCHSGRSGLDPRAVAPLALIRVADGLGDDPLDPPLDLVGAARWLLDGDVAAWLRRPAHRLLVGREGDRCLVERDARTTLCLVHVVGDELLHQVAVALGDRSFRGCHVNRGSRTPEYAWQGAAEDLTDLVWSALGLCGRLTGWYAAGVSGTPAYELAQHGVRAELLGEWVRAGFTVEQAAAWCSHGEPEECARLRAAGRKPIEPVVPVLLPPVDPKRGLSGYDRWQYARRHWTFEPCALCGASAPTGKRCFACQKEQRTRPLRRTDWAAYEQVEELGEAYAFGDVGRPVRCGAEKCQTPLALSAVDEGARQ